MADTPTPSTSKSFYTQKIAGVPLVAWVAVGAVAVGGFLWWHRSHSAAAAAANAQTSSGVPTAATSEELMAAGLYQPPNITYDLSGQPVQPAVETPNTQANLPPGKFLGADGVLYDANAFWWVQGVPYPKWQFSTQPSPGSPGSVGFLIPPQGWPFATVPSVPAAPNATPAPTSNPVPAAPQQPTSLGFPAVTQMAPAGFRSGGGG